MGLSVLWKSRAIIVIQLFNSLFLRYILNRKYKFYLEVHFLDLAENLLSIYDMSTNTIEINLLLSYYMFYDQYKIYNERIFRFKKKISILIVISVFNLYSITVLGLAVQITLACKKD